MIEYKLQFKWFVITNLVTKVFVNSSEITCDPYHTAVQYILRSLNCTTYTVCILTQTNSIHGGCISTMTRSEAIE